MKKTLLTIGLAAAAALGGSHAQIVSFTINGLSGTTDTVDGNATTGVSGTPVLSRTDLSGASGTSVYSSSANFVPEASPDLSQKYVGFSVAPDANHVLFAQSLTFGVSGSGTAGNQYAVGISTDGFATSTSQNGAVTTSAVNQTFNFPHLITSDTLSARIQNFGTVRADGAAGSPQSGGTFRLTAGASNTGVQLTGSAVGRASGAIALTANTEIRNSGALALGGDISGGFAISKTGTGELTLSGNNTYSGGTTISAGTVHAAASGALGSGNVAVVNGTTLLAGSGVSLSNNITVNSGTALAYSQNFNSLGDGLPTNWNVYTGATASSLGSAGTFTDAATSWATTSGGFYNVAAATIASNSTVAVQAASTDRALGIKQSGAAGFDPGAAVAFSTSTSGTTLSSISLDLMLLNDQARTTTYSIQYSTNGGSAWTTFNGGTYVTPTTFGTTAFTLNNVTDMAAISDQSSLLIRLAALTASSDSGSRDMIGLDNFSINSVAFPTLGSDATSGTTTFSGNVALDSSIRLTSAAGGTVEFSGNIANGANGAQGLTKIGAGTVVLSGDNTFTGNTTVSGGTLLINGALTGTGGTVVKSGAAIGGIGTLANGLTLDSGANIVLSLGAPLTINGGSVVFGGLSVANIAGLSSSTSVGTYTLLNGTATFDYTNVSNIGFDNRESIGGDKFAYFTTSSLSLVVIPEPATWALLGLGAMAVIIRRKLRKLKS